MQSYKKIIVWQKADALAFEIYRITEGFPNMGTKRAAAEVFLTAFKTLSRKEQDIFLSEIFKYKRLREDLIDIAIDESRAKDKSRPFRDFLKEHSN